MVSPHVDVSVGFGFYLPQQIINSIIMLICRSTERIRTVGSSVL